MKFISDRLILRAQIIQCIRDFFISNDFLEVETPYRIPANAPEDHIDPFLAENGFLQTSPELCMKRLLCRGYTKIFQISRCWRKNERGRRHLPEFTMLEWYRSDSDYHALMDDCQALLKHISNKFGNTVSCDGFIVRLHDELVRISVREAFNRYCYVSMEEAVRVGSFDELMVTHIEPGLSREHPVILMDYPLEMASLARIKLSDPTVAERFELYIAGMELANGFSELNEPNEQRRRFNEANTRRQEHGAPALPLPEQFLSELGQMPSSAGIALGIDRLVMVLTGTDQIDDVVAFTPESL
jgi:lysyl-tRNA synthetase class 2